MIRSIETPPFEFVALTHQSSPGTLDDTYHIPAGYDKTDRGSIRA
jgi:hypothetical protein